MRSVTTCGIIGMFLVTAFAGLTLAPAGAADGSRATGIVDIIYSSPTSATLGYADYEMWLTLDNSAYHSPDYIQVRNCSAKLIDVLDPEGKSVGISNGPFTFKKTESDPDEKVNLTSWTDDISPIRFDMKTSGKQGKFEFKIKFSYKTQKGSEPQVSAEETDSIKVDVKSGVTVTKRALMLEDSGRLYAGTEFQHIGFSVYNGIGETIQTVFATMDLKVSVPWLTGRESFPSLSLEDSDSTGLSVDTSYIRDMSSYSSETFNFRIAVKSDATPGIYPAYLTVKFTRKIDDKDTTIEAQSIPIEIEVEFTPLVTISSPASFTVVQGSSNTAFNSLIVKNIGNADLSRMDFWIDIYNYFEQNNYYYEGEGGDKVPDPEKKSVVSIEKGGEVSLSFTDLKLFKYLPPGEHRIQLRYTGYYYDDGSAGDPSGFLETDDQTYRVIMGEELYIDVLVEDYLFDVSATSSNSLTLGSSAKDVGISVSVTNKEAVDVLYASFSLSCTPKESTTPLLVNPKDPAVKSIAIPEIARFAGLSTTVLTFNADLADGATPGFYTLPLTLNGYDGGKGMPLSPALEIPVSLRVNPASPKLEIVGVQASDIKPGEPFTLTLTIKNTGGTRATGVSVSIGDPNRENDYSSGNGDFTPDVAFAEDTLHPFSTQVSIKYVDNIDAGASGTVAFMMNASDKTVTGRYYEQAVTVNCRDDYGRTFTSAPEISMQVPGDIPSKPIPPPDYTPFLYPLIIGMILVMLAFGLAMGGYRVYRKHKKEDAALMSATTHSPRIDTSELTPQEPARAVASHRPAPQPQPQTQYQYQEQQPAQQSDYYSQQPQQYDGRGEVASGYQYSAEAAATDAAPPRACPRCGRSVAAGMRLCPTCGCAV